MFLLNNYVHEGVRVICIRIVTICKVHTVL